LNPVLVLGMRKAIGSKSLMVLVLVLVLVLLLLLLLV
jgi:hypothetical protein